MFPPEFLVFCAGAIYILALLIIDQVILRVVLLFGSIFYVWYYAIVDAEPMWAAIFSNLAISSANAIGLGLLLLRKSRLSVPRRHADIYPAFHVLPPGDFRKLMALGKRHVTSTDMILTEEGSPVRTLYFVLSGELVAGKRDETFPLPERIFVGEVGYLTEKPASATTTLKAGGEVIEWDVAKIERMARRNPRFDMALDAAISIDLAEKVSLAGGPVLPAKA